MKIKIELTEEEMKEVKKGCELDIYTLVDAIDEMYFDEIEEEKKRIAKEIIKKYC